MEAKEIKLKLNAMGFNEDSWGHMHRNIVGGVHLRIKFQKISLRVEKAYRVEGTEYSSGGIGWNNLCSSYLKDVGEAVNDGRPGLKLISMLSRKERTLR